MAPGARCALSLWSVLVLVAPAARADRPRAPPTHLIYTLGPGTGTCPDGEAVRRAAVEELEHDPFDDAAARTLRVSIGWRNGKLTAGMELRDEAGKVVWENVIATRSPCPVLASAVATSIAIRLDPGPGPGPAPCPVCPVCVAPEPPKPPPVVARPAGPAAPVRVPVVPRVGAGARADFGPAWGALFGVTIEGGFQRREWGWGGWSLMGALRWAPQQAVIGPPSTVPSVDVSTSLVAGGLTGCVHRAWAVSLAGCLVGELGEVQQSAGGSRGPSLHQTVLFAGGGVGARIEVPLPARLYVQMATDVLGVARLAGSTSQSTYVFGRSFGGAAGGLGAGLGVSF